MERLRRATRTIARNLSPRRATGLQTRVAAPIPVQQTLAEQVRLVFEGTLGASAAVVLVSGATTLLVWGPGREAQLTTWLGMMIVTPLARLCLLSFYRRADPGPDDAHRWAMAFTVATGAVGVSWATAVWWVMPVLHAHEQIVIIVMLTGTMAAGVPVLSPLLPAAYAYIAPPIAGLLLQLLSPDADIPRGVGAIVAMFSVLMLVITSKIHRTIFDSIRLRFENEHLARDVGAARDRLSGLNDELRCEIVERMQAQADIERHRRELEDLVAVRTDELVRAKEEAEQASRAKSEFLATVSHELRTPLHGVLGTTQLLLAGDLDAMQRNWAGTTLRSAQNLLAIIEDILDFSKIEAGRLELEQAPFAVRDHVNESVELLARAAEAKGLALRCSVAPAVPEFASGDSLRLRQILLNLVGNAVKFTEHGHVEVRVAVKEERDGCVLLEYVVEDTGPGLSPAQIEAIFEPFSQGESSEARRHGGTGLGLSIVRRLSLLMGGDCGVETEPGRGASFWFRVRLTRTETAPAKPEPPSAPEPVALGLRVLLVEDNPVNQEVATAMLHLLGCRVEVAVDGAAAVEAAEGDFDLILMDLQLPILDGVAAAREIRAREASRGVTRGVQILALTATALPEARARCREAGMDGFLVKPFEFADLEAALGKNPSADERGLRQESPDVAR